VKLSDGIIQKVIASQLNKASKTIDDKINAFNKMIDTEGPYTFDFPIFGKKADLNLTMTKAPGVNGDLIKLNFNGLFDTPQGEKPRTLLPSHDEFPEIH